MGVFGGRTRTRTLDPLIKSQLLYQLSYAPAVPPDMAPGQSVETTIPATRFVGERCL